MTTLTQLPIAFFACDDTGALVDYNQKMITLLGHVPVIGNSSEPFGAALQLYHADGSAMVPGDSPIALCLAEGQPVNDMEMIVERFDHTKLIVCVNVEAIKDKTGRITGAVAVLQDIGASAALQQTNKALKRSEERYHKMIEEVEDYAILLLSKEGIIQNWNRGAQKIKGYAEQEIVGQHFRVFYLPKDQAQRLPEQLIAKATNEGKAVHEGWRVRKDKTVFWGSIVITALHDAANNIIGFSKVTRDLTERKRTEDELAFQNQELQRFAYVAAHDMKEPLRKLHYYTTYISTHAGAQLPVKEKNYLARAIASTVRMQSLIDDLLSYSKASNESVLEVVDLNMVLEEVKIIHQEAIEETGAIIDAARLPVIAAIRFQMVQLFDNIVSNALKYRHPERRPCINITSTITNILPGTENIRGTVKEYHCIHISDNGIGFDSASGDKIFDVFQRLHNRSDYAGTGIGLAICKKIVQNHKGYIQATGAVNEGAVFTVYMPAGQ